jgi:hypothetical protein
MKVPPYTALSRAKPCGDRMQPHVIGGLCPLAPRAYVARGHLWQVAEAIEWVDVWGAHVRDAHHTLCTGAPVSVVDGCTRRRWVLTR